MIKNSNNKIMIILFAIISLLITCSCNEENSVSEIIYTPTHDNEIISTASPTGNLPSDATAQPTVSTVYMVPDYIEYADNDKIIKYSYFKDKVIGYDNDGKEAIIIEFYPNGNIKSKTEYFPTQSESLYGETYIYNDSGMLVSANKFKAGLGMLDVYKYNDAGMVVSVESQYSNAEISIFDYRYNGTPKKQVATYKNGSKSEYLYNDKGLIYKEKYFDNMMRKGKLAYDVTFEYDEYNHIVSTVKNYYDETGYNLIKTITENFDITGNVIYSCTKEGNNVTDNYYFYDDKLNLVFNTSCYKNGYIKEYSFGDITFGGRIDIDNGAKVNINYSINYENDGYYLKINDYSHIYKDKIFLGVKKSNEYVNSINYIYYLDADGNINYKYYTEYNYSGKKISEAMVSMRNNSESYLFSYTYDYNNKGKIVKITEKDKNKANIYSYNDSGKIISVSKFDNNKCLYTINYEYSQKGNIMKLYVKNADKEIFAVLYDENGEVSEKQIFDNDYLYVYDKNNIIVKKILLNSQSELYMYSFAYNVAGVLSKTSEKNIMDNILRYTEYTYDDFFNRTGWILKDISGNEILKYDKNTLLSGETEYDANGILYSLSTYDAQSNKVKVIYKSVTKDVFDIYQKCNIFDLIPNL